MKTLTVLVAIITMLLTLSPVVLAQQPTTGDQVVACTSVECMNMVKVKTTETQRLNQEEIERELCFSDGLTWREKGVTYVFNQGEVVETCFRPRWHTFMSGGPE